MLTKYFRRSKPARKPLTRLGLVALEARDVPATFTVINTNDAGIGSLRQAVINANNSPGFDTIAFSATFDTAKTISLTSGELLVTDGVNIDGPGSALLTVRNAGTQRVMTINSPNPMQQLLNLNGLTIRDGTAIGINDGGAILVQGEKLTANDVRFLDNQTTNLGGAVFGHASSILQFTNCEINGNEAEDGGAIYGNTNSVVTLFNTDVVGNVASSTGGGVYVRPFSTLVVSASELRNNSSGNGSGGALLAIDSDLTVLDSLIVGNTALRGGGIVFETGNLNSNFATLRNSTISGNRSTFTIAGGMFLDGSASDKISIQNCTITANTNDNNSGGGVVLGGITDNLIESTIISGNAATSGPDISNDVSVKLKNTAVGVMTNVTHSDLGGNFFGLSPTQLKLGPLISNGGPRQSHAIFFGSPIQDQGTNPGSSSTDVRGAGFLRDYGGVDIGSYEIQSSTNVTNTNDSGPGSLRQAVLTSNSAIGGNTITFSSLFDTPQTITLTSGQLDITEGVTVAGPGSERLTVRNGGTSRVINFDSAFPAMQTLNLNGVTIRDGKPAVADGGGVNVVGERLTAIDVRFLDNTAGNRGGGVHGANNSVLTFRECEFDGNIGNGGGAIQADSNTIVTLLNTDVRNNTTTFLGGGGIRIFEGGSLAITGCTIEDNFSADSGGGIQNLGAALAVVDSLIANNTAVEVGGGVGIAFTFVSASQAFRNSTISGNRSQSSEGGGIWIFTNTAPDPITIENCTVAANTSAEKGGGLHFSGGSNVAIESSLIAGNSAPVGVDAYSEAVIQLKASAIGAAAGFLVNDLGGNFVNISTANLKLGPLADNGGLRLSHALGADSPILNKGLNPNGSATDSRGDGYPRIVNGGVDIGSYERNLSFVVTNTNDAGPGSLRQALADADTSANTQDFVTFDPTFFSTPRVIPSSDSIVVVDGVEIVGPGAQFVTLTNPAHRALRLNFDGLTNGEQEFALSGITIANSGTDLNSFGGGILIERGDFTIRDCDFIGNRGDGAAIIGASSQVVVENCNFTGNQANHMVTRGGAIRILGGDLIVRGSTFSGNTSVGPGGAINLADGAVTNSSIRIENSTFHQNSSTTKGGAIANESEAGTVAIFNSTITGNSAPEGGGLHGGAIALVSSVISQNNATLGDDIFNAAFSAKNSVFGDVNDVVFDNQGGNLPEFTNPMLAPLAFNGGRTMTRAPLTGSPLINAGINSAGLARDQRGGSFLRSFGTGVDIGAVEVQAPPRVASVAVDNNTGQRSMVRSLTVTFTRVVNLAGGFDVVRTSSTGPSGPVPFTLDTSLSTPQQTIAKLRFTDSGFTQFGSLIDGDYRLIVIAAQVTDGSGQQLDGNGNGTGGDSHFTLFHRLFGDVNGDRTVDGSTDFAAFGNTFGVSSSQPGFNSAFDFNNDGTIDGSTDFAQFGARFGLSI